MRAIIVPDNKEEIKNFINNVNYEPIGKRILVDKKMFASIWNSHIIDKFFTTTGTLIDDFETTIIDNDLEILALKKIIEETFFNPFERNLKNDLLALVRYAEEKKSGIIFFF